jgi:YidC/Oxa1 family membrane protein insertase
MGNIGDIWLHLVVGPLTEGLAQLIALTGSAALGIIAFTIVTRVVLLPLGVMQIRSQKKMMALQPELKAIQKRFAKEPEKRASEQMRLYKENGVQPALGCLPLVIQMPVLFGLYAALNNLAHGQYLTEFQSSVASRLTDHFLYLCSLVGPDGIPTANGILMQCGGGNPADPANFVIVPGLNMHLPGPLLIVMTVLSFIVQRMMVMPSADPQQQQMNKMMAFMPLMYLFFFSSVPAGLVLYWLVTNVFSIAQQYFIGGWGSMKSLMPGASPDPGPTPATATAALVKDPPETNGVSEDRASDRRPATRSNRRRKSGRR